MRVTWFRVLLAGLCVAGFVVPTLTHVVGGLVLFWLVFGPPERKPR